MKRCLTLFISRKIQIKTAVGYHFLPTRMAAIKNLKITRVGVDCWNNWNPCILLVGI